MSKTTNNFSPEVRERAVRLVLDDQGQHGFRWQVIVSIAAKIGCWANPLKAWVKKTEVDSVQRCGISSDTAEKMKALERENRELRQGEEGEERDPPKGVSIFCHGGARPPDELVSFIDARPAAHGALPICKVLPIARLPTTITWRSG